MGRQNRQQEDANQPILEHLRALRKTLIISAAAVCCAFVLIFFTCSDRLVSVLTEPIRERGIQIIYTALTDSVAVQAKVSLIAAVVAALPVILFEIWSFVRPALYPRERILFGRLFRIALLLFLVGVLFAYFVVFHMAVNFFLVTGEGMATPMIDMNTYVGFLGSFVLPFGIVFQLPVAVAILSRLGLVDAPKLRRSRKYVLFAIFILAAILTPPDVISQVMLALPLLVLYEAGIMVAYFSKKKLFIQQEEEANENQNIQKRVP